MAVVSNESSLQHVFTFKLSDNVTATVTNHEVSAHGKPTVIPVCRISCKSGFVNLSLPQYQVLMAQVKPIEDLTANEWSVVLGPEVTEIYGVTFPFSESNEDHYAVAFTDQTNQLNTHVKISIEAELPFYSGLHVVCLQEKYYEWERSDAVFEAKICFRVYAHGRQSKDFCVIGYSEWLQLVGKHEILRVLKALQVLPRIPGILYSIPLHHFFNILVSLELEVSRLLEKRECEGCRYSCGDQRFERITKPVVDFVNSSLGKALLVAGVVQMSTAVTAQSVARVVEAIGQQTFSAADLDCLERCYIELDERIDYINFTTKLMEGVAIP